MGGSKESASVIFENLKGSSSEEYIYHIYQVTFVRWPDTNTKGNTSESPKILLNTLLAPCMYTASHMLRLLYSC